MIFKVPRNRVIFNSFVFLIAFSSIIYLTWTPLGQTYANLRRRYLEAIDNFRCLSKNDVVFIKTHKTRRAPLLHILLRYGFQHELRVALPNDKIDFNFPSLFDPEFVAPHGSLPYNVICHNMRLDVKAVREITNKDAIWVTMLSDPAAMFETLFRDYWHDVPAFKKVKLSRNNSFERWLDRASEFKYVAITSQFNSMAQNPVYFSFGYSRFKRGYVELVLEYLDDLFNLVLIEEYLDESLVLLADLLCWDLSQVVYIEEKKVSNVVKPTEKKKKLRKKILQWNEVDVMIYDHFNATFWRKVAEFGRLKMSEEVQQLKYIRDNQTEKCVSSILSPPKVVLNNQTVLMKKRQIRFKSLVDEMAEECKLLMMSELTLSKAVFKKQSSMVKLKPLN